jgi:Spirocyclase AveC-like
MVTDAHGLAATRTHSAGVAAPVLAFVGALALMPAVLFIAGHSGGTLQNPVGSRAWELAMTGIAIAIFGTGVVLSIRTGKLSRILLIALASGSAFWQETYGDWGSYLLYSPEFARYAWGATMWSSPVRCWWFIPGYIFFYTTFFLALERGFHVVKDRRPDSNPYLLTTVVSFPMFYAFDLTLEGTAHGFGWWQYQYAFGPSMPIGHGHFPLLWPVLEQVPFMVLTVFGLTWRNADGEDVFELLARKVTGRQAGQLSILVSWIVTLNMTFLSTTILPLMALRWIAGPASATVP